MPLPQTSAIERAGAGTLGWVRVVITENAWDGSIRRRALDTSGLADAGRCESLIGQDLTPGPAGGRFLDPGCFQDLWRARGRATAGRPAAGPGLAG